MSEDEHEFEDLRRQHTRAYTPWTVGDDRLLRERCWEGASVATLARDFGRLPSEIEARLAELDLVTRSSPRTPSSRSTASVARVPSRRARKSSKRPPRRTTRPTPDCTARVEPIPTREGKPWTTKEDHSLCVRFSQWIDARQLAREFLRTPESIEARLAELSAASIWWRKLMARDPRQRHAVFRPRHCPIPAATDDWDHEISPQLRASLEKFFDPNQPWP